MLSYTEAPRCQNESPLTSSTSRSGASEALRARIEQEAKKSDRSLNREIIHRLGMTFGKKALPLLVNLTR